MGKCKYSIAKEIVNQDFNVGLFNAFHQFQEFKDEIIKNNRFFVNHNLMSIFDKILDASIIVPKGTLLYRGRVNKFENKCPYSDDEMGKPKPTISKNNRANPLGIPYLYLASDIDTVIAELRPNKGNYITVATFEVLQDIKVVELNSFPSYKKFEENTFYIAYVLAVEFSRPINTERNDIEYLPTQYFSEYCKNKGFYGIKYLSGVSNTYEGFNYSLFYDKFVKCKRKEVRSIEEIKYSHSRITE